MLFCDARDGGERMAPQFLFGRIDIFLREAKVSFAENTTFK